ncbi:MAG: hypothetical protein QW117_03355 [Candidatus Pacearchaeota archaeon]
MIKEKFYRKKFNIEEYKEKLKDLIEEFTENPLSKKLEEEILYYIREFDKNNCIDKIKDLEKKYFEIKEKLKFFE